MTVGGDTTRYELAAFLRTRRERLDPEQVALPQRRRARRTPGLRREEVAELAGVSVDYVVRLEQGRAPHPSAEVLEALAAALRLTDDEHAYLFDLARQHSAGPAARRGGAVAEPICRLVRDLSPLPAMVLNHRIDILAWNPQMAALMLDFGGVPPDRRNTMWLCVLHPVLSTLYVDRERTIREGIADLRAAWAARPDDAGLAALVAELAASSAEFEHLWTRRDVRVNGRGRKSLRHPTAGLITVDFEALVPLQDPDQRLVVYRPVDEASQRGLDTLLT